MDDYPKVKTESFFLLGGINTKASAYINEPTEFRDILNLNFVRPGALTSRPGSTMYVGPTLTGTILGGVEFQRLSGASYVVISANTNLYTVAPPGTFNTQKTGLLSGAIFNFVTFVDRLFCANGNDFFKFDGSNNYLFSLPAGITGTWGVTAVIGGSLTAGVTGTFVCAYGYMNERGYAGPVSNGFTITINGATFNSITYFGMTQPTGFGITALQMWRSINGSIDLYGTTFAVNGATQATDIGFPVGTSLAIPHLYFTLVPRYQAIYNNQYFMAGFSSAPSLAYWSEIGEPEAIQPTFFNEFRSNDGDRITGMKFYRGALLIFKQKSVHALTGDNPSNFSAQELTLDYGALSQQAIVTFNNVLWFLDQKGIVQYDGAQFKMMTSDKIEPYLLNMNVAAAIDNAVAIHYRQYSEVWFAFPSNGATVNDTLLVYDYLVGSWTRYTGINPSIFFTAQGVQNVKTVFYGGYTGALFYVGSSFYGDNGTGITYGVFSKWLAPAGQTTESMYRRFWLDVDPILGVTLGINLSFYKNYSSSVIQGTGMIYANVYQTRLDFGISSRSLAFQAVTSSASLPFKINSYTFESRYLRSV